MSDKQYNKPPELAQLSTDTPSLPEWKDLQ